MLLDGVHCNAHTEINTADMILAMGTERQGSM